MLALDVKNIDKAYIKNTKALNNLSFQIQAGEFYALLGPNGSGKTTLISIISSLIQADSGSVEVFGQKVGAENLEVKKLLGIVPQEIVSHGFFTIEEILVFVSGYYGIKDNTERINFLLDRLGLEPHRKKKVAQLSGGMKRRLLIAKALVHKPKLLLLDEPTAGVDIELRNSLWEFAKELNQEGLSILLTTHYLQEAESLCSKLAIIDKGSLIRTGATKDIISEFTNRKVEIEVASELQSYQHQYLLEHKNNLLKFCIPSAMPLGQLLQDLKFSTSEIRDIKVSEGSLEEAFLKLVSKK